MGFRISVQGNISLIMKFLYKKKKMFPGPQVILSGHPDPFDSGHNRDLENHTHNAMMKHFLVLALC